MAEKLWIDTEDGRQAVVEIANIPEVVQVLSQAGNKHISTLIARVLDSAVSDIAKDRQWVVAKAELDGAKGMLKYLMHLIQEAGRPNKRGSN